MSHRLSSSLHLALLALSLGALGVDNCADPVRPNFLAPGENPPACGASLQWMQGVAPPGGVQHYDVHRNGRYLGSTVPRTFVDYTYLNAGSVYTYEVRTVGNDGVVYVPGRSLQYAPPDCPPTPDWSLQVEVFQVGFSDVPLPQTSAAVQDLVFGPTESVARYWEEASYRRQLLSAGSVRQVILPGPIASYCNTLLEPGIWAGCNTIRIKQDLVAAVAGQVNWYDVERAVLIVYGFRWRGSAGDLTTYAGDIKDVIIGGEAGIDRYDITTIVHELGHNGGVNHASAILNCGGGFPPDPFDPESGGCTVDEYEDFWDPMGEGSAVDDSPTGSDRMAFGIFHKEQLGFLRAEEIGVIRLADLAVGERRTLYLRYIDPAMGILDGMDTLDWWIDYCMEQFPAPLAWKIILDDPVHLSIEGRAGSPRAIVRLALGTRTYFRGDSFLASPPWVMTQAGTTFEDPRPGIRIRYQGGGAGALCSAGQLDVERIAAVP